MVMDQERTWLQVFPPLPFYDLHAGHTALLVVDMQYLDAHRDYGMGRAAREHGLQAEMEPYFAAVDAIVPRIARLIGGHGDPNDRQRHQSERNVDGEHCPPAESAGQHTTEQRANGKPHGTRR